MELSRKIITEEIDEAIESNQKCGGNLMLRNRVFFSKSDGKPEILVSLNNRTRRPHYWGHIFWHEDKYVSCIIAVDFWLTPYSVEKLFEEFWKNLTDYGWWYPVAGEAFASANTLQEASSNLVAMIKVFDSDRELDGFDYRVVQVYPFPDPFKEYI